jgi:hypothetical protein
MTVLSRDGSVCLSSTHFGVPPVRIQGGYGYAEALVVACKETGLEVNADTTKYMVMSRDQNAGRSYSRRFIIALMKGLKSSNICEQPQQIKMLFRKNLRAD